MVQLPDNPNTTIHAIDRAWVNREAEDSPRAHLGASQIGRPCAREIWYSFRWVARASFSGRILRLFHRGHREEPALVESLRMAGVTVHETDPETGKQFRFSDHGGHIGGSMDGCALGLVEAPKSWHCLEFKTSLDKYFKILQKQGVEKAKPEHFIQMQLYMLWSGMKRAYYLVVNKNDDQLYAERVRFDKARAEAAPSKAKTIVDSDSPPDRLSNDSSWWQCRFCDYREHCHGERVADVNCRTCCHATPETDGDARWSCAWHKRDISVKVQQKGCEDHRFIPALIPFARAIDGDQSENWIEYQVQDRVFRNGVFGEMSFTSKELVGIVVEDFSNKSLLELRQMFDGEFTKAKDV